MATVNLNLKNPKSSKPTPINLIVRWNKQRLVVYTRESIHPKYWQSDKTKKNYQRANKKLEGYPEFNRRLDNIVNTAMNAYWEFKNNNENKEPTPKELQSLIKQKLQLDNPEDSKNHNLMSFINLRVKEERNRIQSLGKKVDNKSQAYSYRQTKKVLEDYAEKKNRRVDFDTIDLDFYFDFIDYCEETERFSINNIGKHIKNLKAILNEATERGINSNMAYTSKKFKVLREDTPKIYLTEQELKEIYKLNLPEKYERARDLFLIGAYTGLRFSDLTNIKSRNFKTINSNGSNFQALEITMQKTGEKINIPLDPIVLEIKEKYKDKTPNSLPKPLSNQKMNEYLKEICKAVESLKKEEESVITKGGKKITRMVPKHELVTTHTARRSFATNMYKRGIPSITIRKITGHNTESSFLKYIQVTPEEHAAKMYEMWQKNGEHLRKVE
ncbi:MAG: tyrosine-type recombinase/integrase [archaeon]